MEQALRQIGQNIRKLRVRAGYSQEDLAEKANLHRTYIGTVERGETNISIKNLLRLSRALQSPISKILTGVG